jgi:fermentation-respiration switch protein FrsA (DUF1100 family)
MKNIFKIVLLIFLPGCTFMFFYPEKKLFQNPYLEQFSVSDVYFKATDGIKLHGWLIKGSGSKKGTIIQFHGNAENISTHVNSVLWLALEGYDIFTFDYRGYGRSQGVATIDGVHKDGTAALQTALRLVDEENKNLYVLGQSLGGAIAVFTIARFPEKDKINALILDSAFSGYRKIVIDKLNYLLFPEFLSHLFSLFFEDYYSPVRWIKELRPVPVLIIHGDDDKVVSEEHAIEIFNKASEPKELWIIKNAGHIHALADEDVRKKLLEYLDKRKK